MNILLEKYIAVQKKLVALSGELSLADNRLKEARLRYEKNVSDASASLSEATARKRESLESLNAFIEIAKMHTARLVMPSAPKPYDKGRLATIAVQINSGVTDDPYATMLFTEATAQQHGILEECERLKNTYEKQIRYFKQTLDENERSIRKESEKTVYDVRSLLRSKECAELVALICESKKAFAAANTVGALSRSLSGAVYIGSFRLPFPVPEALHAEAKTLTGGLFDAQSGTIEVPAGIDMPNGSVVIAEYTNDAEGTVLSGIQKIIHNIVGYYSREYSHICFFDPIRYNSGGLGCFAGLFGKSGTIFEAVPSSAEELRAKVKQIIARENAGSRRGKSLYIFHNFPQGYDAAVTAQIQQLCANAQNYGITVILTHNKSSKYYSSNDTLAYIRSLAITVSDNSFVGAGVSVSARFDWYRAPDRLPQDFEKLAEEKRAPAANVNSGYIERVGIPSLPKYRKGVRRLENIPFGVDEAGVIKSLDFEDSNFATFICGAARSGKSTLLNTLLTGFIANNHPDDIEIWLIDFKMTEFSRYIDHLPPHVRYILLDESPELVYDIIDRLTEIMLKRKTIFMNKWLKLSEVPPEKYMPAILVVIDEFSIMSKIIADSVASGKENYVEKLQALLALGSGLGLHFIFSSQVFTNGTRGLNDYSKQQIQQRIAMKADRAEIRETLGVKSPSEADDYLMEHLPVHHAVTRVPRDENGNHLRLSKVLYISDYSVQERMIDAICAKLSPAPHYNVGDPSVYVSKKPLIKDGNSYLSFEEKSGEMKVYISYCDELSRNEGDFALFAGDPKRMLSLYPIRIYNEFCENILMISPLSEKMPAASVVMSLGASLALQGQNIEIWSSKKNPLYNQLARVYPWQCLVRIELGSICRKIKELKTAIMNNTASNQFYLLLGAESLITDMSYAGNNTSAVSPLAGVVYENRPKGQPDLNTMLAALSSGQPLTPPAADSAPAPAASEAPRINECYDARADLKFILTNGPHLGYHFIVNFSSVGDVSQSKTDISLFKHKLLFRTAKNDAALIVGAANAADVAAMGEHTFRYSNGLESVSFRPYLHPGLSWDGWQMKNGKVVNEINEEDEYLL